jgi:hypothetical protein
MASNLPAVTFADLFPTGVSVDQKTISMWLQVSIGSGVYATGGIPAGVQAQANAKTIDDTTFLFALVESELTRGATYYTYKYIPTTDKLQIFSNGTELSASAIIPSAVLTDTIVGEFTYNRL